MRTDVWVDRWTASLSWRCLRRFTAISGYDRALGLAAQAFLAVIPTFVVVAAVTRPAEGYSNALIARYGLSGNSAQLVEEALRPPSAASASIWGTILLVISGIGFARALQRSYRAAWGIRAAPGIRGWLNSMVGVVALAAGVVVGAYLSSALRGLEDGGVLLFLLRAATAGALWLLAARLLLGRSVGPRALLPGAVVTGVGQAAISLASDIWMPRALAAQASSYGVVGVCAVLISWLILLGLLVVLAAAVAAELRPDAGSLPISAPERPPGSPAADEDRSAHPLDV